MPLQPHGVGRAVVSTRRGRRAADLNQVHRGKTSGEYRDLEEFFRRTYLTVGLTYLLSNALQSLMGNGSDSVVELHPQPSPHLVVPACFAAVTATVYIGSLIA